MSDEMKSTDGLFHVVSVSGGKDSTALYLWAIDKFGKHGFRAVFADTGHEHPVTLNYVRNLPAMAGGPNIDWVKADFSDRLLAKGKKPSGNPFLDMMLWKNRAPSSKAQFCTEHLKLHPIRKWLIENRGDLAPVMYVGIRAGESVRRSKMPEQELNEFMDCMTVRPLLKWSEEDVFSFLASKSIQANPLYEIGFQRVGCFPCIHSRKSELASLPDWAWKKLDEWETKIGTTWFAYGTIPLTPEQKIELASIKDEETIKKWKNKNSPCVAQAKIWAKTTRGGSQIDLFSGDEKDVPSCMATWGICS